MIGVCPPRTTRSSSAAAHPFETFEVARQAGVEQSIFVRIDDVAHGADGFEIRRRHRSTEDVGVRARIFQQHLEIARATDEAAETGKGLRQRTDDQRVLITAQGIEDGTSTLITQNTGAMSIVDVQDRVVPASDAIELGERRQAPDML